MIFQFCDRIEFISIVALNKLLATPTTVLRRNISLIQLFTQNDSVLFIKTKIHFDCKFFFLVKKHMFKYKLI